MWEFPSLSGPTLFVAAPGDVAYLRDIVVREHAALCVAVGDDHGVSLYQWMVDKSVDGFADWIPAQGQLPRPSDPNCRAVICMFGERIGTPLPADFPIASLGPLDPGPDQDAPHVSHPFDPASIERGGFALSGTVFEYLAAVEANARSYASDRGGRPPVMLLFVGDDSLHHETDPRNANWGGQRLFEQARTRIPKRGDRSRWETGDYNLQIAQLRNFFDYVRRRGIVPLIVENEGEARDAIRRFLIRALDLRPGDAGAEPFKGLQVFDTGDATVFFGREDERRQVVAELGRLFDDPCRPTSLGIIGGSGVGKSSFMRAGVVARLCHSVSAGHYRACVVSPGELVAGVAEPTGPALLRRLFRKAWAAATGQAERADVDPLEHIACERQPAIAVDLLCEALHRHDDPWRLVIAIDQFEELVDQRVEPGGERWEPIVRFIDAAARSARIGVVYTLQTNRLSQVASDAVLGPLWARGGTLPLAFPGHSLTDIITKPFEYKSISVDPALVAALRGRIIAFAEKADPGSQGSLLPLVSLVLQRIFEAAVRAWAKAEPSAGAALLPRQLTLDLVTGDLDIKGALAAKADEAAEEARQAAGPEWSDKVVGSLLRRLVRLNGADRERLSLPFAPELPVGPIRRLADALRARRMLIMGADKQIKLVHEAVCHSWPAAAAWLTQERRVLTLLGVLGFRADDWNTRSRPALAAHTVGTRDLDEAAEVLALWLPVLRGNAGVQVAAGDAVVRDYCIAILASQPQPGRAIEAAHDGETHMFLAASYNDVGLLRTYLEIEPGSVHLERRDGQTPLFLACGTGSADALQVLLDSGANPSQRENDGWTPLHVAAHAGNLSMVDRLLEAGAVLDADAPSSPIELAAREGHIDIVRRLLDAGIAPGAAGSGKTTALHSAAGAGHLAIAHLLLERGASPGAQKLDGCSPLHCAVYANQIAMVKVLLQAHAAIEMPMSYVIESAGHAWSTQAFEVTPLQIACDRGHHETARVLLEAGADPDRAFQVGRERGRRRWSLLHHAVTRGDRDLVRLLVAWRTDHEVVDTLGITPLGQALKLELIEIAGDLVHAGASLKRGDSQLSYLQLAAQHGRLRSVEFLLDAGNDPDTGARGTDPPLILAARAGSVPVVALLLDRGAALAARGQRGCGPLHAAVISGDAGLLELLIERGTPLDLPDSDGRTALHLAASSADRSDIVRRLIECGADREAPDQLKMTPLHVATQHGSDACVHVLLAAGASPHACDIAGWTALHFAAQTADRALVERLVAAGAALDAMASSPAATPFMLAMQIDEHAIAALLQGGQPPPPPMLRQRSPATPIDLALTSTQLAGDAHLARPPLAIYPSRIREAVHRRDGGVCRACGFHADRHQDVVYLGANARDLDDLATICIFCVRCLRLDLLGENEPGILIYLPELTQTEISHAAREIYVARLGKAALARRARAVHEKIKARRERATKIVGTDAPGELARMLEDAAAAGHTTAMESKLQGIRLLPIEHLVVEQGKIPFDLFPMILAYWRSPGGPCHDAYLGNVPWIARLEEVLS
jgi:ankyrin repeat protein